MGEATPSRRQARARPRRLALVLAGALGVCAALLVSCGSSGKGLIPSANAGPLKSDFDAVAAAAAHGDGSCTATEDALSKTEEDFGALPASIDSGLRETLRQGIANLRVHALELCLQPIPQTPATTASTPTTTSTASTTTTQETTQTSTTQTAPAQTTSTETSTTGTSPGGGTAAPGEVPPGSSGEPGSGSSGGESSGGGADGGGGAGAGAGQESGK